MATDNLTSRSEWEIVFFNEVDRQLIDPVRPHTQADFSPAIGENVFPVDTQEGT